MPTPAPVRISRKPIGISRKWAELFLAFDEARLRARTLQQRDDRRFSYRLLLCLLAASAFGFLYLLLHRP